MDELRPSKKLEMGELVHSPRALKEHLSGRLYERGYIMNSLDRLTITDAGPRPDPPPEQLIPQAPALPVLRQCNTSHLRVRSLAQAGAR